jgi:phage-related protein
MTLQGFGSAGVLEVVEDSRGNTYRAIYTVRFDAAVYMLHVFQKKSTQGIATRKQDLDLIKNRLKLAEQIAKDLSI